jgi:hypothetical protein
MDTGTRDMLLSVGDFVENFTYDKWQELIQTGSLDAANVISIEENKNEKEIEKE